MRYFEPDLRLAALLPPQDALADKFGGLPWGLPPGRWPVCDRCGQPQSLLAQLRHHPDRLGLGRAGRVLHVFQCADWWNTGCDPSEPGSGANACFVLGPDELGTGLTAPPGLVGRTGDEWAWRGHVAARVLRWAERDEDLPADERATYFDPDRWYEVRPETADAVSAWFKLGGVPYWGNAGPADAPPVPPWRFAVQLTDSYGFAGPAVAVPPTDRESGGRIGVWPSQPEAGGGGGWGLPWANFAQGVGYVYLDGGDPPAGQFSWQRW